MKKITEELRKRKPKIAFLLLTEAVLIGVILYYLFFGNRPDHAVKFFITMFLVMIPLGLELMFSVVSRTPLFCFAVVYACGHTAGSCFGLYLSTGWWDKMLHCVQGMLFTILVYYLLQRLYRAAGAKRVLNLVLAVSLAVLIAVLWEVVEFSADKILSYDMQKDTYVSEINSFLLADQSGEVVSIKKVDSVVVNGQELPGYVDVGLNDTMWDLIMSFGGAFLFAAYGLLDGDRHPLICLNEAEAG